MGNRIALKILAIIIIVAINKCSGFNLGGLDSFLPQEDKVYSLKQFGPKAKITCNSTTVSGFSSGGFMSMQFHVAYSSFVKGSGMFAGGPYGRTYGTHSGTIPGAINLFSEVLVPEVNGKSTSQLKAQAQDFEAQNYIDPLQNLLAAKAFVFHGLVDPIVHYSEGEQAYELHKAFGVDTRMETLNDCSHGVPTDSFGGPCAEFNAQPPYDCVNNCGYEGIFRMFRYLYDDYVAPASSSSPPVIGAIFYTFDQTPFVPVKHNATRAFMAPTGLIYIPPGCQHPEKNCKLHLAMHGCAQSIYTEYGYLGNPFASKTGYTQVADANNVVVIFPQPAAHYVDTENSNALCWDALGGTSPEYLFKSAPQMQVLYNIIAAITGEPPIP